MYSIREVLVKSGFTTFIYPCMHICSSLDGVEALLVKSTPPHPNHPNHHVLPTTFLTYSITTNVIREANRGNGVAISEL